MRKILDLPVWVHWIIVFIIPISVLIAFFFLYVRPRSAELSKINANIETVQAEIKKQQDYKTTLESFKQEVAFLEREKKVLEEKVPLNEIMFSLLLPELETNANEAGIELNSIKSAGDPVQREKYAEVPFEIETQGMFFETLDFFYRLERTLSRYVRFDSVSITPVTATTTAATTGTAAPGVTEIKTNAKGRMFIVTPAGALPYSKSK